MTRGNDARLRRRAVCASQISLRVYRMQVKRLIQPNKSQSAEHMYSIKRFHLFWSRIGIHVSLNIHEYTYIVIITRICNELSIAQTSFSVI